MIRIFIFMLCLASATAWLTQIFAGFRRPTNQTQHHAQSDARHLKCQMLSLCSLGHVKPFLGDIYDGERCLSKCCHQRSCSMAFIAHVNDE